MSVHDHNRVILLLMVKNESRIIERCIENAIGHVDAVALLDTGSTDDTVLRAETLLKRIGKPYKIEQSVFINFGISRTASFENAQQLMKEQEWDGETTYALAIDADMVIKVLPGFKGFHMKMNGYSIIQSNGSIKYHNTRIMRCGYPWKCVGATHEYWSGDPVGKIEESFIFIDDRNDGGCKHDKFERDIRLLSEEIETDPKNDRAHYYLGQSLKDTGKFQEAIAMFTKRIALGGWREEVHYAHYQIGKCYELLGDEVEMEHWMRKAFQFYPGKAEPVYHLTRYYREKSQHYKAYHYYLLGRDIPYPKDDLLFIENAVYEGLFHYEATILDCYVTWRSRQDSLINLIQYINRPNPLFIGNVWDNLVYYVEPLMTSRYHGQYTRIQVNDYEEYKASSSCLIPYLSDDPLKRYALNLRMVNYSIDAQGAYHMRSPDGKVKTKNTILFLNSQYRPTTDMYLMTEDYVRHESNIEGLEDIRLFYHGKTLKFIGASKDATPDSKIVMVCGDYLAVEQRIDRVEVFHSPHDNEVEKNWVYVPNSCLPVPNKRMNFIHGWNPLQIGSVNEETKKLEIHTSYPTPAMFGRVRGSSPLVVYEDKMWCVAHIVKYSTPRVYCHTVVQFHKDTMRIEKYAVPFFFRAMQIEYCIGFHLNNDVASFFFSENDTSPGLLQVPLSHLKFISL